MKKILSLIFAFTVLCMFVQTTAFAEDEPLTGAITADGEQSADVVQYFDLSDNLCLVDNADLLTSDEESALEKKLEDITVRNRTAVVIVTVESLEGKTATAFADDFFDYNGYGIGADRDGVLFLLSMEARDWAISTHGFGITAFTDAGQEYIMEQIKPELSDDNYNSAFTNFAELCDTYLIEAKVGNPYDIGHMPDDLSPSEKIVANIVIAILLGAVISFFIMLYIKSTQNKTVRYEPEAKNYIKQGSFNLTGSSDTFLYASVSKVAIPTDSSGGSSTHTSSSGATHGGSSGKF